MKKISPSILSADLLKLGEEIRAIEEAGADYIHIDIMDGHFVPNITFGPGLVEAIRRCTKIPLDVHLMISEPEKYIEQFVRAGSDILTFHIETSKRPVELLKKIRGFKILSGISLNPDTPAKKLTDEILKNTDWILIMTVYPGFSSQKFIPEVLPKLREVRKMLDRMKLNNIELAVDGGVKLDNIAEVAKAGATVLASGSGIFKTPDYKKTISEMRRLIGS